MQEGEPILGGGSQVNPNNTQPTNNPGIQQPVVSATTFAPSNTTGGGQQLNRLAHQQQPYNQSFQQFQQPAQFPAQSITSGSGDIVLQPESRKNHKKWLLGVIPIFIALATLIFFIFTLNSNKLQNNNDLNSVTNYREAFNQYANYILYGKYSIDDIIEEPDNIRDYAIWVASGNKDMDFLDKSKSFFTIFAGKNNEFLNETTGVLVQRYTDVLNFYYLYNTTPKLSYSEILNEYMQNGKESAYEYINKNYEVFENSSELSRTYGVNQKEIDISILEQIDDMALNDCLENGDIKQSCINSLSSEILERRFSLIRIGQTIEYDTSSEIINGCFMLADEIYNLENK